MTDIEEYWLVRHHIAQLCPWQPEFESRLEVLCQSCSSSSSQCFPASSPLSSYIKGVKSPYKKITLIQF